MHHHTFDVGIYRTTNLNDGLAGCSRNEKYDGEEQ
jgi:hypothetical protein